MFSEYIHIIGEHLAHHPMIGLVFTFLIAMVESIAVLGTLVPGIVTMTIIGTLIGSGIMPLGATLSVSILGALTGDFLSYWFGLHYRDRIYQMWPFNKYQKLMALGERFFAKHGGKSVVIGRFVGPVRSMVPLIAGLLQMRVLPFFIAAFISATAWSIVYLFPGFFLGALSMELPKATAGKFLAYTLLWIFILWASIWLFQYLIRKSWKYIDAFLGGCWRYLKAHPKMGYPLQFIVNPKNPHDHRQFTLLTLGLLSMLFFFWVVESVYFHGFITELDVPLFNLFQSFRTNSLDHFMVVVSFFGEYKPLAIASALIFALFLYRRAFWIAAHWAGVVGFIYIAIKVLKWLVHAKRPDLYHETDIFSSFPSGHVSLSFALFGFSAVLIASELTNQWRRVPYWIVTALVTLIAISRLYLGQHWLSDVVGSLLLSLSCVLLFTVSYRRRLNHLLSARFFLYLLPTLLLSSCIIYGVMHRINMIKSDRLEFPVKTILKQDWWENNAHLPLYRNNRFGKPIEPLNISWLGQISDIQKILLQKGWVNELKNSEDLKTRVLKNLIKPEEDYKLPWLPTLYHDRSPALVMTRRFNSEWLILELWPSDINIANMPKAPLWIGAIYTLGHHPHKWFDIYRKKPPFQNAIHPLLSDIKGTTESKVTEIPVLKLPKKLKSLIQGEKNFLILKLQS